MTASRSPRTRTFPCSRDAVARWADLARDHNPLHLDPDFAAGTRFGVPIAHGHLLACVVLDELQEALGSSLVDGGEVDVRFRAPVPVGSEMTVDLVDTGDVKGGKPRVRCQGADVLDVAVTPASPCLAGHDPREDRT